MNLWIYLDFLILRFRILSLFSSFCSLCICKTWGIASVNNKFVRKIYKKNEAEHRRQWDVRFTSSNPSVDPSARLRSPNVLSGCANCQSHSGYSSSAFKGGSDPPLLMFKPVMTSFDIPANPGRQTRALRLFILKLHENWKAEYKA